MYNTQIHTVQAMRRNNTEFETYEQYGAKLAQSFVDFDRSAEWIFEWARREITLNKETFRHTLLALKQIKPILFDEVMSIYTEAYAASATKAPATTEVPAAPVLKSTDSVKSREFPTCPATTYEQAQKYGATPYTCGCPDRAARNGSYTGLDGRPACKHMIFKQRYYTDIAI